MSPSGGTPGGEKVEEVCLRSWKEIASYAHVSVATVQRWERWERLPVHRHMHRQLGSVYAYPFEIDEWLKSRDQFEVLRQVGSE